MRMITVFSSNDLTNRIPGAVTFEEMMIPDIQSVHAAAIADSDAIFYVDGQRIKVLKHWNETYIGSEIPVSMLRPLILSGIANSIEQLRLRND
jgi:hypothetical protein